MPDPADPAPQDLAALEVERTAAELGAVARQVIPALPWVIHGEVDGRAFLFRERAEEYVVIVATDVAPSSRPWGDTVAAGVSDDLIVRGYLSPARAVHVAVAAVRTWLRQRTCAHDHDAADRYCSACGIAIVDPALP
jgi:hypothetical protein